LRQGSNGGALQSDPQERCREPRPAALMSVSEFVTAGRFLPRASCLISKQKDFCYNYKYGSVFQETA